MKTSEKIDLIAAALAKAQAEIGDAKKDGKGNYGRYTTLASVVDACKAPLLANGISFVQTFEPSEAGRLALTTTLLHTSGQFISGTMSMPLPKQDPQGFGSATTYGRRFGLAAMVGVCPEDDDGAGASGPPQGRQQRPQQQPRRVEAKPAQADALADPEDFRRALHKAFDTRQFDGESERRAVAAIIKGYGVDRLSALDLAKRHAVINHVLEGGADKYREAVTA